MTPVEHKDYSRLAKLTVVSLVIQLTVIGYVFYQSYTSRVDLIHAQRASCERAKLDRLANAEGWRSAESARRASGDLEVAREYQILADQLEIRGKINCYEAFPKVRILP